MSRSIMRTRSKQPSLPATFASPRQSGPCEDLQVRIIGHGVDLIEFASLDQLRGRAHFDERCFTDAERRDSAGAANATTFFAGTFAAKEAVLKALGTGLIDGISWHDIEVRRKASGAPTVSLSGRTAIVAAEQSVGMILLSISHTETIAMASVITVAADEG
jgi:holo-[acyl-carrier protein] synthase